MKTIDYSYYIERYITGEMSDDEKMWFLKEIDRNEKLRNEVNLRKRTDTILESRSIIALRNKLSEIEKTRVPVTHHRNFIKKHYLQFAAVISVLIIIGSITLFSIRELSNEDIISKYYEEYRPLSAQRSGHAETNNDFKLALEFYNSHDYRNAAVHFKKVLENKPGDMQSEFLYGVSNFEDKKYPDAIHSFDKVISDNNNLFLETAEWYLALCYIKTDDIEKAVQQLEAIISENSIYKSDSKKIMRKLR